jgi:hypothetical protein
MNAQKVWYMFEGNNLVKAWENAEMRIKMQICATRKTKRPKRCCIQYLTDLKSLEEAL